MKARVFKSTGSWYRVETEEGRSFDARLRGKIRLDGLKTTNPIAVGDWVEISPENDKQAVIRRVLDRDNYIIRKSTRKAHHSHIIAANIDQALLVCTLSKPRTSQGFIDRFLVSCEAYHIPAVLVFNKSDLMTDEEKELYEIMAYDYRDCGYSCLLVSALNPNDVHTVKELLIGKISLLSGHSGVGKSTLLNAIDPTIAQRTAEISEYSEKGIHTTTFAEMFVLENDALIIDTPGIKEYGLVDIAPEELATYFPEMQQLAGGCKFHNCTHLHEPGCAVLAALEEGKIPPTRYESYLSILEDHDNRR